MGVCNCSMFCCTLLNVHSSIAIIFMGKRELIALLILSPWCLVMVERLFLAVPRGCLQFVIVVFPDHTHLLFFTITYNSLYHIRIVYGFVAQSVGCTNITVGYKNRKHYTDDNFVTNHIETNTGNGRPFFKPSKSKKKGKNPESIQSSTKDKHEHA